MCYVQLFSLNIYVCQLVPSLLDARIWRARYNVHCMFLFRQRGIPCWPKLCYALQAISYNEGLGLSLTETLVYTKLQKLKWNTMVNEVFVNVIEILLYFTNIITFIHKYRLLLMLLLLAWLWIILYYGTHFQGFVLF